MGKCPERFQTESAAAESSPKSSERNRRVAKAFQNLPDEIGGFRKILERSRTESESSSPAGEEIFSFDMDDTWLKSKHFRMLDPDLQRYRGMQYIHDPDKSNFGLFLDSSPDRWGRMLMRRREAILARQENRSPYTLHETDYLLGVYDKTRMGALRFKTDIDGEFLDADTILPTPPWTSLRDLENEDDNSLDFDLAMNVASHFRLSDNKALQILREVPMAAGSREIRYPTFSAGMDGNGFPALKPYSFQITSFSHAQNENSLNSPSINRQEVGFSCSPNKIP